MVDFDRGFSASYYANFVDPASWLDMIDDSENRRLNITGGAIKRVTTDLRESADVNCTHYTDKRERLIRVWLDTIQGSDLGHTALFTGYSTSPGRDFDGTYEANTLQCYSVLKPAQDMLLPRGYYAPVDVDGTILVRNLLKCTGAPIEIVSESSELDDKRRRLRQVIIAESGETHLTMADRVLDAMNWRLLIDGYGRITICPYSDTPVASYDSISRDILLPTIKVEYDWYDVPNVVRAIFNNESSEARDENPDSPFSIVSRGREVWYEESNVVLNDNESLNDYAIRRLKELQRVSTSISYDRRYDPNVRPSDAIDLNFPRQDISGKYLVTSQTIDLGYGATTSEEVINV